MGRANRGANTNALGYRGGQRLSRRRLALLLRRPDQQFRHRCERADWPTGTVSHSGWRSAGCSRWRRTRLQGALRTGAAGGSLRTCAGTVVVAPQRPIRGFGGFVQLGLPLSRWFNADPKGHNAGWQLLFTMGKDQVNDHDLNNPGFVGAYNGGGTAPLPLLMGKTAIGTLYYKFNNWCQFAFEQSVYATRGLDHAHAYTRLRATLPTNGRITEPNSGRSLRSRPTVELRRAKTGPLGFRGRTIDDPLQRTRTGPLGDVRT